MYKSQDNLLDQLKGEGGGAGGGGGGEARRENTAIKDNSDAKVRYLHIINPYSTSNKEALESQKRVMASIESARAWIQYVDPSIAVDIVTIEGEYKDYNVTEHGGGAGDMNDREGEGGGTENIQESNDEENIPPLRPQTFYRSLYTLSRSSLNLVGDQLNASIAKRPMPLLRDILNIGKAIMKGCEGMLYKSYCIYNIECTYIYIHLYIYNHIV